MNKEDIELLERIVTILRMERYGKLPEQLEAVIAREKKVFELKENTSTTFDCTDIH